MPLAIKIDFEWRVYPNYRLERGNGSSPLVVGSGPPLSTRPSDQFPGLYLELANADRSDLGHLAFAKKYGLLTCEKMEPTDDWPKRVEAMSDLVKLVDDKRYWAIRKGRYSHQELRESFTLRYERDRNADEISLAIVPSQLFAALVLQCVSNRASGGRIRACKACGTAFEVGGTSGRRFHREYCSDKCRYEFAHRDRSVKE